MFRVVCWITKESYAQEQIAFSHKGQIWITPQRVEVRSTQACVPFGKQSQSRQSIGVCGTVVAIQVCISFDFSA